MKLPTGQSPKRERVNNRMQTKPENRNGNKPAGHNGIPSKLMTESTPSEEYMEAQRIAFEATLANTHPMKSIKKLSDLLYAMDALNCVLITNYTTLAFCRNDQWRNGLHLEIPANMLAILSYEFLSQWQGNSQVKDSGVEYLKQQWFKKVNILPEHQTVWVLCQQITPLTGNSHDR